MTIILVMLDNIENIAHEYLIIKANDERAHFYITVGYKNGYNGNPFWYDDGMDFVFGLIGSHRFNAAANECSSLYYFLANVLPASMIDPNYKNVQPIIDDMIVNVLKSECGVHKCASICQIYLTHDGKEWNTYGLKILEKIKLYTGYKNI